MKKRFALMLVGVFMLCMLPFSGAFAAKQMRDGVPVWTEETVKQYARSYVKGEDMEALYGYYDLQIRRYMPMETYEGMLTEIEWITGKFIDFGTYDSFQEEALKLRTHVLHLCMEKQDLDLYFTHKDKEDDWEVMAVEFVFAERQAAGNNGDLVVVGDEVDSSTAEVNRPSISLVQQEVVVGSAPFELKGLLTLPEGASASQKVPACVLVHGSGPSDMDESIGQTKFFADIAEAFAERGIATLRYDKRTYTYGAGMTPEEVSVITVEEETIQDAILAGQLLKEHESIDSNRIVLVGHSMGAMLAPRIVNESNGLFSGVLMIAGTPKTLLDIIVSQNQDAIAKMEQEAQGPYLQQLDALIQEVKALSSMTEEEARATTIVGVNGYYFWEMQQHDPIKLMKKMKIPMYVVQGNSDFQISVKNGVEAYEDALGDDMKNLDYKVYVGLNHLLMKYTGDAAYKGTVQEYDHPAKLDTSAARDMAAWVLSVNAPQEEETE